MTTPTMMFNSSIGWLDGHGKGAWMAAMILGFIFLWPVGLAILFFMIWSNRMSGSFFGCNARKMHRSPYKSSGNSAFDAYRDDTIKRLEDDQGAFKDFLQRLREAKDKTEFDTFLDQRAKEAKASA